MKKLLLTLIFFSVPAFGHGFSGWQAQEGDSVRFAVQYSIGLYDHQGRAFERDDVMAHMWLNIASANGQSVASEAREIIEGEMTRKEILLAQRLARQCVENNYKNCGEER